MRTQCPECHTAKPARADDLHDVVLMRPDWRSAARKERTTIYVPLLHSLMCNTCYNRIRDEFSPSAPKFDKRGHRIYETELALA